MLIFKILLLGLVTQFTSDFEVKLEHISTIQLQDDYSYQLIAVNHEYVVYQEYYMKDIIKVSLDGTIADTLKVKLGRGPGEYSGGYPIIKVHGDYLYLLDLNGTKIIKFSLADFSFIDEIIVPPGSRYLESNDRVFVRNIRLPLFYQEIDFETKTHRGLPNSTWEEKND